ncbi:spindle and kinetochore-associated protein 1-like isoform X1 [Cimex lectularius]|uniref:SKA complex subunit 1 n=2 Tax=Cimex lectularius TaxID=79782 RepID=A0A8I6SQ01_CIMLE|nr:spindle and kinetochore-associated protein 1-like isoform X1 [Cimex lectularius]
MLKEFRMEELMAQVNELKLAVDIMDGYRDPSTTANLLNLTKKIDNMKMLITKYKSVLNDAVKKLEEDKIVVHKLDELDKRMEYVINTFPKELLTQEVNYPQQESKYDYMNQQLLSLSPINPLEQTDMSQKENMRMFDTGVSKPPENKLVLTCLEKSNIPTPEPRRDLEASVNYVTNHEFSQVPQYMKGRLKLSDINRFIDIYNNVLNKKNALLTKPKKMVKTKQEMEQCAIWKQQMSNTLTDNYFCTLKDFDTQGKIKLGKKDFSILTILRHLKRIREVREKSVTFYAACF